MIEWIRFCGFRVIWGNHLLSSSIPGNASQPLKWKSVCWHDASSESDHSDSVLVKEWNDSSVMAVHSQEKNFGTMWLLTYSWFRCIFALQGRFTINRHALYYRMSFFIWKKHLIQGLESILTVTVQWDSSLMLSQSLWFIQSVHSFRIDVKQYNELFEEGHTWTRSGNSYLSGSWTGKQPVQQPITWQEIPY